VYVVQSGREEQILLTTTILSYKSNQIRTAYVRLKLHTPVAKMSQIALAIVIGGGTQPPVTQKIVDKVQKTGQRYKFLSRFYHVNNQ